MNSLDLLCLNAVPPVKKIEQSGLLNNKKGGTGINFQRMIEETKRASKKSSEKKEEVRPSTLNQNLDYAYMAMGSLLTKRKENKEI